MKLSLRISILALAFCGLLTSCIIDFPLHVQYQIVDTRWKLIDKTISETINGVEHEELIVPDYDYTLSFLEHGVWKTVTVEKVGEYDKHTQTYKGIYGFIDEEYMIFYGCGGIETEERIVHIDFVDDKNLTLSYNDSIPDAFASRHVVADFSRKRHGIFRL